MVHTVLDDVGVEDLPWMARTIWRAATLESTDLAAILDVQEASIRQYAAKNGVHPNFPPPALKSSGRNYWTPDQIFRYITDHRRHVADRIPRLYTAQSAIGPAKFLFAERRSVLTQNPMGGEPVRYFVMHHWLPADLRGPIAVAYPGPPHGGSPDWDCAAALLEQTPSVTAVALVTDDLTTLPDGTGALQPVIGVIERHNPPLAHLGIASPGRPHPTRDQASLNATGKWGWFDLANLLRVDIPWWPPLLRDLEQIAAWAPGTPRQKIRPRTATWSPAALEGLVRNVPRRESANVAALVGVLNRLMEGEDAPGLPDPALTPPGIVQAAEVAHGLPGVPAVPLGDEFLGLLHCRVKDGLAADHAARALWRVPGIAQVAANVVTIDLAATGPLAREWLKGRREVSARCSTELGFALVRAGAPQCDPVVAYYNHDQDPHTWIIETRDYDGKRRVHLTVGPAVPARGWLVEFELHHGAAFFRDSEGHVWPIPPVGAFRHFASGHRGQDSEALFCAVSALRVAADASAMGTVSARDTPLWRAIRSQAPPLSITPADLDCLVAGA